MSYKEKFLAAYFIWKPLHYWCQDLLCCQINIWIVSEIQCRCSFVCLQIELQSERNVTWDCTFRGASRVPHKGEI
jgi:hypothetical protein